MSTARVLVVDDEPTLRSSMARGLSKVEGLTVDEAGNIEGALKCIDRSAPLVIVSDIDLPDRSGIELLGELGKRGLSIPIIFVSAYLKAFRAQIPKHGNFEALEKPVPLEQLRALVQSKLERKDEEDAPFSVADYLQLSAMGRHSVRISARSKDGQEGLLIVSEGTPWSAEFGQLRGAEAFATIAFRTDLVVHCSRLTHIDVEQNLNGSMDSLLMESARLFDEARKNRPVVEEANDPPSRSVAEAGVQYQSPLKEEPAEEDDPLDRMFDRHWEAGVDALLSKNYPAALESFETAGAIRPDDPKVIANIKRLLEMGVTKSDGGEEQ